VKSRPLSFADAPAIVIALALLAYLIAGAAGALGRDYRLSEARSFTSEDPSAPLSGIAIEPEALCREADAAFVWVCTAGRAEKKTVNIIHVSPELILVEAENAYAALRPGDRLIIGGQGLYEGKILT